MRELTISDYLLLLTMCKRDLDSNTLNNASEVLNPLIKADLITQIGDNDWYMITIEGKQKISAITINVLETLSNIIIFK